MTGTDTFMVQRMAEEQGPYSLADLQLQVKSGDLRADSMVRRASAEGAWFRSVEIPGLFSDKDWLTTAADLVPRRLGSASTASTSDTPGSES